MGCKSYFCDYCRCYMKNDKNVRKTHNDGLQHKITKASVMRKYDDPSKVYEEEIKKQRCVRYFKSYCKYGLYCQFTHYSDIQLKQLQEIVNINAKSDSNLSKRPDFTSTVERFILPWQNKITKTNLKLLPKKLPPSLKPLNLKRLSKFDVKFNKWG